MRPSPEHVAAWTERQEKGVTLTQKIHQDLISNGLMRRSPFSRVLVPDSGERPDLSLFLSAQRSRIRRVGPPPAFALDVDAPKAIEVPTWFAAEGPCDVSVIVPLYKSRECIQEQIASWDLPDDSLQVEVIYVDDCCPQSSYNAILPAWEKRRDALRKPVGKIVRRIRNGGFSAACNTGARYASGQHLVFLNADCTVTTNWLHNLYARATFNDQIGIVGNMHLTPINGKAIVNSCGSQWHWITGNFEHIGGNEVAWTSSEDMKLGPREMVTGCCFIIDSELFWSVGGFDPNYAIGYWEDSDLCMKVRTAGKDVWFEPSSVIYHGVGHSGISNHPQEANNRNRFHQRWVRTAIIDRYVGQRRNYAPQSFLIKRLGATGDVLVAASVAGAIKQRYPDCRVTFQTFCPQMLAGNPHIDEVVGGDWTGDVDAQIILDFASENLPYTNFLSVFASVAGERPEDCRFFMQTEPMDGLPDKYVAMHIGPTGSDQWKGRMWPQDRFAELAERIVADGLDVVVIGDARTYKNESPWCDGVLDLRGMTSLYQMAHVVKNAQAFCGIDSMPMHVAQVFNKPGACIFGSVLPETRLYRLNMKPVTAQHVSCLGCHNDAPAPCSFTMVCRMGFEHCMNAVSVDEFYTTLKIQIPTGSLANG